MNYPVNGWRLEIENVEGLNTLACANPPYVGDVAILPVENPLDRLRMEHQASMNSCTAHAATTVGEWCAEVASGGKYEPELSRQWLYNRTRERDGWRSDSGSSIFNAIWVLCNVGCPLEEFMPYTGRDYWQLPRGTDEAALKASAELHRVRQHVTLRSYEDVLQWCNRGRGGVVFGAYVDSAFMNNRSGIVEAQVSRGGGHALAWLFPSPRKDRRGRHFIWGPNSWGTSWGRKGWAEYAPDYIEYVCRTSPFGSIGLTDMVNIVDRPISFRKNSLMRD